MAVALVSGDVDNVFFFVKMFEFQLELSWNELFWSFWASEKGYVPFTKDWIGFFGKGWEKAGYLFPHENASVALFPGDNRKNGRRHVFV